MAELRSRILLKPILMLRANDERAPDEPFRVSPCNNVGVGPTRRGERGRSQRFPEKDVARVIAPAVFSLTLAACAGEPAQAPSGESSPRSVTGVVDVFLHDAPLDAVAVWVTVERLRFKPCEQSSFIDVDVATQTVNLLELQNGVLAQLLDDTPLPVGRYCETRLVLSDASSLVDSSYVTHQLKTPSGSSSGFKLKGEFQVIPGDVRTIVNVDFDAEESIHARGRNGYILKPVIQIDSVEYETVHGNRLPPGEYLGHTTFTVDPARSSIVDLGGGSTLTFPMGAVIETTTFVATRWAPYSDDIRSDIFRFSPHYRFVAPPYLELTFEDDGRPGQMHLDYDVLRTTYSGNLAAARLPHFSITSEQAEPCAEAPKAGFYCNADWTRLYSCNDAHQAERSFACDCLPKPEDPVQGRDACHWAEAPWSDCLELTPSRDKPYHDGEYRDDGTNIALDFTAGASSPELLCGFDQCEVEFNCRDVDGNGSWSGYGPNVCVYEKIDSTRTGRWMFVAHLSSIVVDPTQEPVKDFSRGEALGVMGEEGQATGIHFHMEFGVTGDAAKLNDAGAFPAPLGADVLPNMRFCGGDAPQRLDTIEDIEPTEDDPVPLVSPAPPSAECDQPPRVVPGCHASFSDMPEGGDCWWCDAVRELACAGIIQGYPDGTFRPGNAVNRAEFLKLVLETAYPCQEFAVTPAEAPFADVEPIDWFAGYVSFAKDRGIVEGTESGVSGERRFEPGRPVTREEASKLMVLAGDGSEVRGYASLFALFDPKVVIDDTEEFADVADPEDWFYPYVYATRAAGILTGYGDGSGLFGAGDSITRAAAAEAVHRAAY